MLKFIALELRKHLPFTAIGAVTGIIIMLFSYKFSSSQSYNIFYILHPLHVLLSAFTTASMYILHAKGSKKSIIMPVILIGYFGSVGIATLSDSLIPYLGELMLDLPNKGIHLGFIEKWYLVNPLAFLGILLAFFKPTTKFPHAGHVLLSTWASTFHIIMALGIIRTWYLYIAVFVFLFFAVWIPCCTSDIVFPLIFAGLKDKKIKT
ncbi:MAG: hypothetical protein JW997_06405 [Actinobacteria bacterium]|nr:hypothetical protein [Actinomycetota bacterium]